MNYKRNVSKLNSEKEGFTKLIKTQGLQDDAKKRIFIQPEFLKKKYWIKL